MGHGAGSRRGRHDGFCREACAQGFVVLALDFRGHGDSGGRGDGPLEQDIFAAVDLLRSHPRVDPERVCYRGSSMGGFYGLKAAAQARFAALALLCPASEGVILDALDDKQGGVSPRAAARSSPEDAPPRWDTAALRSYFQRQDSVRLASQVECPVLLVHARGDDVVPLGHSLRLCRHLAHRDDFAPIGGRYAYECAARPARPPVHFYLAPQKERLEPRSAHTLNILEEDLEGLLQSSGVEGHPRFLLHAFLHTMTDEVGAHVVQGRPHGRQLGENLFALLTLFDHALQAAHLTLDAGQPVEDALLVPLLPLGLHLRRCLSWSNSLVLAPGQFGLSGPSYPGGTAGATAVSERLARREKMERSTGFEPATSSLGSWHSTN